MTNPAQAELERGTLESSCFSDFQVPGTPGLLIVGAGGDFRAAAHRDLLVLVLQLVKFVVDSALCEQLLVRSFLAHQSLVHDDDLVSPLYRRKPMSDHHRRAAFHHAAKGIPDLKFSLCIHT